MEKVLLTVTEAARVLGLGRTKLYELIGAGEIPIVRIGRAVRVPTRALDDWVEHRLKTGNGRDAAGWLPTKDAGAQ